MICIRRLNLFICVVSTISFCSIFGCNLEDKSKEKEVRVVERDKLFEKKVREFVPPTAISSETSVYSGDLNQDRLKDAVLRFKVKNESLDKVHFYILLGKNDSTLKVEEKDIFSFNNKRGVQFDTIKISKNSNFSIRYIGTGDFVGSYREITFKHHFDGKSDYWILSKDEELFQHKVFAPAPQKPIIAYEDDMRGIGGEFFSNIKENLYDVMLRKRIEGNIPDSISECRAYAGDLNRDEFEDIILRFKIDNEDELQEHFHLFTGKKDGTYELSTKNDSIYLDGVDGTAFDKIVINNGYFSIEYRGYGNTGGSYEIVTFKYSEENKNWLLHRQGSKFMHRHFTDGEPSESMSTQQDFGHVLFKDFGRQ